jgi:hypothetical protein
MYTCGLLPPYHPHPNARVPTRSGIELECRSTLPPPCVFTEPYLGCQEWEMLLPISSESEGSRHRDRLVWYNATLVAVGGLLLLLDKPVLDNGGLAGSEALGSLNLDGQCLVLLEAGGKVGLLGGLGGLGEGEGGDLADGVGLLDGGGLVGFELLEVELLDEVGCGGGC